VDQEFLKNKTTKVFRKQTFQNFVNGGLYLLNLKKKFEQKQQKLVLKSCADLL